MKTIEVSDEIYDKLMDLSKEINNQSHRSTAMPYFFQVSSQEIIFGVNNDYHNDGFVWVKDGDEYNSDSESMKEALLNEGIEVAENVDEYGLIDLMEENGFETVYFKKNEKFTNCFFTEKACKEHIKRNDYHYNEPRDYLSHAFRNPEMELIQQFLCEISGGKIHK